MVLTLTAIILAVKAYFLAHGASIGALAIVAGVKAAMSGRDPVKAAISRGASAAAADLLNDFLKNLLNK